jgi:hypothetical protein
MDDKLRHSVGGISYNQTSGITYKQTQAQTNPTNADNETDNESTLSAYDSCRDHTILDPIKEAAEANESSISRPDHHSPPG